MHTFAQRHHKRKSETSIRVTKGLILDQGWRYDLTIWFTDTFLFRRQVRDLRRRAADLANLQPGEHALDVGCGTGTLALDIQCRVGASGRVAGIDPGAEQIARARAKAARRGATIAFREGVIERLPFPDQAFDVVFSTLMMHHLPASLKRLGLAEIARVLKPGGRLVIADFTPKQERAGAHAHFHAGGSDMQALATLMREFGFAQVELEVMRPRRYSAFPGAGFVTARKG